MQASQQFPLTDLLPKTLCGVETVGCGMQQCSTTKSQCSRNVPERHWRLASEALSVNGVSRPLRAVTSMTGLRNKIMWRRATRARMYKYRQATAFIPQLLSHLVKSVTDGRWAWSLQPFQLLDGLANAPTNVLHHPVFVPWSLSIGAGGW